MIDFLNALRYAKGKLPEMRYCQIIVNALGGDPFYTEDGEAARAIKDYADEITGERSKKARSQ